MPRRKRITSDQTSVALCYNCNNFIKSTNPETFDGHVFCSDKCIERYEKRQMPTGEAANEAEDIGETAKQVIIPDE